MDCKEFEKKIPTFIANELDYKELKLFLEHIELCPDCKEELTIQVLVSEGMARLEEGSAFDLQVEIDKRMQDAAKRIRRHRTMRSVCTTLVFLGVAALALIIAFFVI